MTDTTTPFDTAGSDSDDVAPTPDNADRRQLRDKASDGVVLIGAAVAAIAVALAFGRAGLDQKALALLVGAVAGAALAFTAVTKFVTFLLVLVVLRGTLDGLKLTGVGGSAITEPGVMVGGVLLIACVLWLLAQRSAGLLVAPSNTAKWMAALAGAGCLGVVAAGDRAAAAEAAIRLITSVLTFVVIEQLLARRPQLIRGMLAAAMLSMVVPAIVGLRQLTGGSDFEDTDLERIRGTFVHPNALASYAVTLALVGFAMAQVRNGRLRVASWTVFAVASTLLFFTYGRAAWAGMLIGLGYLLWHVRPQLLAVFVAAILMAPLAIPSVGQRLSDLGGEEPSAEEIGDGNANSFAWRQEYWVEIAPLWNENPVIGIGLDQVPTRTDAELQPHSVYVQAFVEMGTLGIALLLGLILAAGRDLARARRAALTNFDTWMTRAATATALAFAIQMISENLLTQVAIHLYLWIPLAYATALPRRTLRRLPTVARSSTAGSTA